MTENNREANIPLETPNLLEKKRSDGPSADAPFWARFRYWLPTSLIIFAVTSGVLTHYFINSRDTLLPLIPADAIIYIHSQGAQIKSALQKIPIVSVDFSPDEAAAFATSKNSELVWTKILCWNLFHKISEQELTQLHSLDAQRIGPQTFVLGAKIKLISTETFLDKHRDLIPALSAVRGLNRTQTIIMPEFFVAPSYWPPLVSTPIIAGITTRERANYSEILITNAVQPPFLGLKIPSSTNPSPELPSLPAVNSNQTLTFSTKNNTFNLVTILFTDIENLRQRENIPDSFDLAQARSKLNQLFLGPIALTIEKTPEGIESVALLPQIKSQEFAEVLTQYLNRTSPTLVTFKRPDGVKEQEFLAQNNEFVYSSSETMPQILTKEPIQGLNFPIQELPTGLLVASSLKMFDLNLKSTEDQNFDQKGCSNFAEQTIQLKNFSEVWKQLKFLSLFFNDEQLNNIVIQRFGDNSIKVCG